ncbi:hypothetical protein [Streptomyces sp. SDr-06]|uniref:hypothetical protein n=1 Tax=Streptomyces sp. SDr-06 TaxID=2267702 RepID=UPI0016759AC2|nr:hypothetical protein [Streptomyces sp. SDr-06]
MRSFVVSGVFVVMLAALSGCSEASSNPAASSGSASASTASAGGEADCDAAHLKVSEQAKPVVGSHTDPPRELNEKQVKAFETMVKIMDANPGCFSAAQVESTKEGLADAKRLATSLPSAWPTKSP